MVFEESLRYERPSRETLEARGGIEPPIKVLQTFALPLGDRATESGKNQAHKLWTRDPILSGQNRKNLLPVRLAVRPPVGAGL